MHALNDSVDCFVQRHLGAQLATDGFSPRGEALFSHQTSGFQEELEFRGRNENSESIMTVGFTVRGASGTLSYCVFARQQGALRKEYPVLVRPSVGVSETFNELDPSQLPTHGKWGGSVVDCHALALFLARERWRQGRLTEAAAFFQRYLSKERIFPGARKNITEELEMVQSGVFYDLRLQFANDRNARK